MNTKAYILLIIAFTTLSSFSQSTLIPLDKDLVTIRNEVQKMVEDKEIPSMAIAVIKNGELIWQEAIGYSNIETKEKVTLNSIYPLGSIAKSITATGIMQMVNTGKISLFDNIQPLLKPIELKDSNGSSPRIELWQLVSNNAGLNQAYGVFTKESLPQTDKEIKNFIKESTIVAFKPGSNYHYSNRSFDIAEILIEQVSKNSFEEYMTANVFKPIGMNNTYAYPHLHKTEPIVKTYTSKMNPIDDNTIPYPAGGSSWWSSISDLTSYAKFHLGIIENEEVISKENLRLIHEFRQGPADLFGIGWFNDNKNQTLYSNGNVGGGNAAIFIDRKNKSAVITLLNRTSWDGIADQINGKINEAISEEKNLAPSFEAWQRIYGTTYKVRYELIGEWEGLIKEPKSNNQLQFSLNFKQDGNITAGIDNQTIEIKNAIYNLKGNFETEFKAVLPHIYDKETKCILHLNKNDNQFEGYIQYDNDSDTRFYTLPLFVKLKKL